MKLVISILLISWVFTNNATAMGPATGAGDTNAAVSDANGYYQADHFQWTNYDDDVHMLTAYAITVVGGVALQHYAGFKPWQAALTMTLAVAILGAAKETLHDNYCSRTDIKAWAGGAAAGGATLLMLNF